VLAVCIALVAILPFRWVRADEPPKPSGGEGSSSDISPPPPLPFDIRPVAWSDQWERFRTWEYIVAPTLFVAQFAVRFGGPDPPDNWPGEWNDNALDDGINDAVAVRTSPARTIVTVMGDIGFGGSMAYRLVDSALLPGLLHDDWDVALQMSMIDMEAFVVAGTVLWGMQLAIGRHRPYVDSCRTGKLDPSETDCQEVDDPNARRSFIAGHVVTAVTGAALTCLHHDRLPLYDGGPGDAAACGTHIGFASLTAITRVLSENHFFTDVLMGVAVGVLAGWVVPSALHYGFSAEEGESAVSTTARRPNDDGADGTSFELGLAPAASETGPGLMVFGRW